MRKFLLLPFFVWGSLQAQITEVDSLLLYSQPARPLLRLEASYAALSNRFSVADLLKVSNQAFLKEGEKSDLLPNGRSRFGQQRQFAITYEEPGYQSLGVYQPGRAFVMGNSYYNCAVLSEDVLKILLFGNQPYEGETLLLGPSRVESWYYSYFGYQQEVRIDTARSLRLSANLLLGHYHRRYQIREAQLYTAPNGEYLDIVADYRLQEVENSSPLTGLGASFGLESSYQLSKRTNLRLSVQNLGLMFFTGTEAIAVDSNFRFRGYQYSNLFELSDSLSAQQSEELRQNFLSLPSSSYLKLSPFQLAISVNFKKGLLGRRGYARAEYLYLAGYLPRLSLGMFIDLNPQQYFDLSFSAGGFNYSGINLAYHSQIGNKFLLAMRINNLNSLIVPFFRGGAQASLALSYKL